VIDACYDLADTLSAATQHALSQAPLVGSNATCGPPHGDSRNAELANMAVPDAGKSPGHTHTESAI
jgi:hypothetical protein